MGRPSGIRAIRTAFVVVVLASWAGAQQSPADVNAMWMQAFNQGDFATIHGLYAPGAIVQIDLGNAFAGDLGLAGFLHDMVSSGLSGLTTVSVDERPTDHVVELVVVHEYASPDGALIQRFQDLIVVEQIDGAWKIVIHQRLTPPAASDLDPVGSTP